jgi:ubiquinone/menaquinone biosynthesis C-methylase UbiE
MLKRVLETEVMDSADEARDYDSMDHADVNRRFVADLLSQGPIGGEVLDLGTGTAQIPIELCRQDPAVRVLAIDLARHMLELADKNIRRAGLQDRIRIEHVDGKRLPYADGSFAAVISNSIVHHIPEPESVLAEAVRVTAGSGRIFVRDLLRPADDRTVRQLVETYAAGANRHQRQMFDDSLRAALDLDEIRALVTALDFAAETVEQTSDRHWTWSALRPTRR